MHNFDVHQLLLKLIEAYNVRTYYYHMQQFLDGPVVVNRNEDYFKMATVLKTSGYDRQKHKPGVNWTVERDARDTVDEIAEVKNINSSVLFVSWKLLLSCGRRMRD